MTDITKCEGVNGHPKCSDCWRKNAPGYEYQAWMEVPMQHPNSNNPICTWKMYRSEIKSNEVSKS